MARFVLTDPEMEATRVAWNAGMSSLGDERWVAVEVALALPRPSGRGAVEIDLDDEAEADLRAGVSAGIEAIGLGNPGYAAMAGALEGVGRIFEQPAQGYGR